MSSRLITIVVPVFEEDESLDALTAEIRQVADAGGLDVQVVFVDDGSRDATWSRIQGLARSDPRVGGLRFRRNAGKAAALMAGFAAAQGDLVIMMDADLQDPPAEIPKLLEKLDSGFDLVSGWKRRRHDPWHKVYPSRVFNRMISFLTGVRLHDHVCGLKCMRRDVAKDFRLYGELHRFLGVLAGANGYRVTEIPTLHRPRTHGRGKYGFTRFFKGFLDLLTVWCITRYRWRPQHLIGVVGLLMILLAGFLVLAGWLLPAFVAYLLAPAAIAWAGLTLIAIGLLAELMVANRPLDDLYAVAERTGWCAAPVEADTEPAGVPALAVGDPSERG